MYQKSTQLIILINRFTEGQFITLNNIYNQDRVATTFLSNYESSDIVAIKLSADSANIWSISPPDEARMVDEINSSKTNTTLSTEIFYLI